MLEIQLPKLATVLMLNLVDFAVATTCGRPPKIHNAAMHETAYDVTYICFSGLQLNGRTEQTIICEGKNWIPKMKGVNSCLPIVTLPETIAGPSTSVSHLYVKDGEVNKKTLSSSHMDLSNIDTSIECAKHCSRDAVCKSFSFIKTFQKCILYKNKTGIYERVVN